MKFPTKVLTLSLVCMNMVTGALDSYLSSSDTNPPKCDTSMGMEPEDITTNSQNHDTNAMTPEDIQGLKEYEKLSEACEELNNLLDNGDIENFIEIPHETAIKVDSAVKNILELIFPKDKMYSSEYWIQKIIENPEDDYEDSEVKRILPYPSEYVDSIDGGARDYGAAKILYSLTPYLNGNKKSNITARSVFGQIMLKITTKKEFKKLALRMILSAFFSKDIAADDFLAEYGLLLTSLYKSTRKDLNKHKYGLYFKDEKLEDFIEKATDHYIDILTDYLN